MATTVIQDNTVSSSSDNVLVYQDTSDDVDSDIESETLNRKRKRSKGQVYNVHNKYQLFDEALEELNKIGNWRKQRKHYTSDGAKHYFKCSNSKCQMQAYILIKSDDNKVVLCINENQHEHGDEITSKLPKSTQEAIIELFENGISKPIQILNGLSKKSNIEKPTKAQLANFLARYKNKKYGEHKVSLGILEEIIKTYTSIPTDQELDKMFVGNYEISYDDSQDNDAITNGHELAFGKPSKRIMCWAHVLRNVNKHLVSIPSETRNAIISDIMVIQLSINEDIFRAAIRLFCDKWLLKNDSLVENFIKYFKEQWFTKQPGWYEGHALGYPSSNNALESTNRYIKEQSTFKDRLSVPRFISVVDERIIHFWSTNRDPAEKNTKAFKTQVEITLADWTAAAQWLQRKQPVIKHKINNNLKLYFVGNKNNQQIDQTYVD
ncbi:hypothetical protein BpHYR1_030270, partial [Brachionus plicatilis]